MTKFIVLAALLSLISCSHPITATGNKVGHDKGEACKRNLFFIIPLSFDNSIYTAAKNGKIEKISTVDADLLYTFFYNSNCTVVRGHKKEKVKEIANGPIVKTAEESKTVESEAPIQVHDEIPAPVSIEEDVSTDSSDAVIEE